MKNFELSPWNTSINFPPKFRLQLPYCSEPEPELIKKRRASPIKMTKLEESNLMATNGLKLRLCPKSDKLFWQTEYN